jgi:Polyketide cyclase / dehydrase and lipid transport
MVTMIGIRTISVIARAHSASEREPAGRRRIEESPRAASNPCRRLPRDHVRDCLMRDTREFHGDAAEVVAAPQEVCLALIAAIDRYPHWCPDVIREVDVLDRGADGQPSIVRMTIYVARGGLVREFNLFLAVVVEPPGIVKLTRVTDHPTNQEFNAAWTLRPAASTRVSLALDAKLRVPWYIRAGGIGDAIAEAFVSAASRRLSTPPQ